MGEDYVLLATANKASQLEQAKILWGHHMPLRWPMHFTSVLIFCVAHMCTFPIADLLMMNWTASAAGLLGVYSINLAGCIWPSKTEQLAVCRMRRFFLAQRAIGCFVVGSCIASGIFIIAVASIYSGRANIDRTLALTGSEVIKQLSLLVILALQAALTIGAICFHNEVLQVLNQDVETNGSACPAEDDKVINVHGEEQH